MGPEGAAESPAVCDLHLRLARADLQAGLGQLGLQGRMEQHRQRQAVPRGALWRLRLLLPALHQQPRQLLLARHRPPGLGRRAPEAAARSRPQAVHRRRDLLPRHRPPAATRSRWARSSCSEKSWEGFESRRGGTSNIEQIYNNGVSTQVIFGIPTASCKVGSLAAHDCLESIAALDQVGAFVTDTWAHRQDHASTPASATTAITPGCPSRSSSPAPSVRSSSPAQDVRRDALLHLELVRAAHRRGLRPRRRRPDRAEGQLRPLLAQPGRGDRRQRQPEHRQQVGDLHVGRRQRRSALAAR